MNPVPHIVHLVYAFDTGGMENGMVNLFNHLPPERFRHTVIALTDFSRFRERITGQHVDFHALHKNPGHDLAVFVRLYRLLRKLKPDLLHTRNLAALEGMFVGVLAGIPVRIHGEHGRDVFDLHGKNWKYNLLRRSARPFVSQYIAVSRDLGSWLTGHLGIPARRVTQIYNGVDTQRFHPCSVESQDVLPAGFKAQDSMIFGSVGRMAAVKDYPTLIRAFAQVVGQVPQSRLVLAGGGAEHSVCKQVAASLGVADKIWMPGERQDIPELMRAMDVFVLPSLNEGISNTILEAMSSGLPVVATRTGGNVELIEEGVTGTLTPVGEAESMAQVLLNYARQPDLAKQQGLAARQLVEQRFSLGAMAEAYADAYECALNTHTNEKIHNVRHHRTI